MNLNISNLTSITNSSYLGTQLLRKMNRLYFTLFGCTWLKNLTDTRKLDVFVMGLLVQARCGSLTTHMQTALTELARAFSMQYPLQRTCSFMVQRSPTHLLKHQRQNKGSSSTQIGHSMTGGSIKRVNHQSPMVTSYPSLVQCRATPSPRVSGKNTLIKFLEILAQPRQFTNCALTQDWSLANRYCSCGRLTTLPYPHPFNALPTISLTWLRTNSPYQWNVKDSSHYRLVWAKKVSLAAICLVAGSASFGIWEN